MGAAGGARGAAGRSSVAYATFYGLLGGPAMGARSSRRVAWIAMGVAWVCAAVGACGREPAGGSSGDPPPAAVPSTDSTAAPVEQPQVGDDVLDIVCTTSMIGDIVKAVAGDHARVRVLMGPGVDPHLYQATRHDMTLLADADIVYYHGLMLEGKMIEALERLSETKRVYAVTRTIEESYRQKLLSMDDGGGAGHGWDPHVWMDPLVWFHAVDLVHDSLWDDLEGDRQALMGRRGEYNMALQRIDWYAERVLGTVPEGQRVLVTAHDAFRYFGARYGFEVVGVQGISTDSEAGLADVERIVSLLVERKVPAVFVESSVSDRNVRALIEGARARGHEVKLGGTLYSDALGAEGTYEGTLIGMLDHNVTTIANALGGEAPGRGLDEKLAAPAGAGE